MTLQLIGQGNIWDMIDAQSVLEVLDDPDYIGAAEAADIYSGLSYADNIQRAVDYCNQQGITDLEEIQRVIDSAEWIPESDDRPSE